MNTQNAIKQNYRMLDISQRVKKGNRATNTNTDKRRGGLGAVLYIVAIVAVILLSMMQQGCSSTKPVYHNTITFKF